MSSPSSAERAELLQLLLAEATMVPKRDRAARVLFLAPTAASAVVLLG